MTKIYPVMNTGDLNTLRQSVMLQKLRTTVARTEPSRRRLQRRQMSLLRKQQKSGNLTGRETGLLNGLHVLLQ